jgi:2-iminobutanoate/2-iminopropanoate deaminase
MDKKVVISTEKAPRPSGPYSQAVVVNQIVFVAGQLGIEPDTGKPAEGIEAQVRLALKNIQEILEASGSSVNNIVKVGVFLKDLSDFPILNKVFQEKFPIDPPARTTVQANLPGNFLVEIDAIAVI